MEMPSGYVEILRPGNCLMAAVAVLIGYAVALQGFALTLQAGLAMVSAFLICGGGQAINDYFDRGIDRKIKPEKPIPSGRVNASMVPAYAAVLFAGGIAVSSLINLSALAIALSFSALLVVYSSLMMKVKYLGNIVVASGTAFTLIYGASVIGEYSIVVWLALSAFLANLGREITKDLEDVGADTGFKTTLPMMLPLNALKGLIVILYTSAIVAAIFVWLSGTVKNALYLILIVSAGIVFGNSLRLLDTGKAAESQKFSKYAMAIALAGFAAGALG
jgi:geranylgeranylglycerol-phosphate geranylgeranyltransferase